MQELISYLESIQAGPISDTDKLKELLAARWDEFNGSNDERMAGWKLHGRMEKVVWNPPILSFVIERHGGTALGSSRAELQRWYIDLKGKTAWCMKSGYRQVFPTQPRLNVSPIAEEISELIINRKGDQRLKWNEDGTVRILIGKILPERSAIKETLDGRRKRLRKALDELLEKSAWHKVRANVYSPPGT